MLLRRTTSLTPDKSVRWHRSKLNDGTLLIAEGAPDDGVQLLMSRPHDIGPKVSEGQYGVVHRTMDATVALKECVWRPWISDEDWDQYCSYGSLALNVALTTGLSRLGEEATLPNGSVVTGPTYFGAWLSSTIARLLMSYEGGQQPSSANSIIVGNVDERRTIYDAAMRAVEFDPTTLQGYDDTRQNLLVRTEGLRPEVVKLDAANWETANPA